MATPIPQTPREHMLQALLPKWVGMGPARSIPALAREEGIEVMELIRHAKRFAWNQALETATSLATVMSQMVQNIHDVNTEQLSLMRKARQKAWEYLENVVFDKPADAIRLLIETTKLEREILGLDKHQEDLSSVIQERLKNLGVVPAKTVEFETKPLQIEELTEDPEP